MYKLKGFSVLELLVVVGVVLIIATIAIPRFLRSRDTANQAAAVASTRAIVSAQTNYAVTYPQMGYADTLSKLGPPRSSGSPNADHAGLLDDVLGCPNQPCMKSGYLYEIGQPRGTPVIGYQLEVTPAGGQATGTTLCTDETGVLKQGDACRSGQNGQVSKP